MSKHEKTFIPQAELMEHPAFKAWCELGSAPVAPKQIEIMEGQQPGHAPKGKSAVFRLEGVGPAGTTVIAKRCRQATGAVERTVYEEVLPQLPIPSLRYYGFVENSHDNSCWLFLEDAGETWYSSASTAHRAAAARWLGLMHTTASRVALAAQLPDGGAGNYLDHLVSGYNEIQHNLSNPALNVDDLEVLETCLVRLRLVESHWSQVERLCDGLPRTLVHGDFVAKNLRVRANQAGIDILPFDWEKAFLGAPLADWSSFNSASPSSLRLDLATYSSVVRSHWPSLDIQTLQQFGNVGALFRLLAAFDWEAINLRFESEWIKYPMCNMEIYGNKLTKVLRTLAWDD